MNMFSLRTVIDDILLLVRNNNISESEDLSRAQIAQWVLAYREALIKAKRDAENDEDAGDETDLSQLVSERGPLELQDEESLDGTPLFCKRTVEKIPQLVDKDPRNLFSVHDQVGHPIQEMGEQRRFYHYARKYTSRDLTYYYQNDEKGDGYIYVQGTIDKNELRYIWIEGLFSFGDDDAADEDGINIPGWMIPPIKENILKNELAFMLARISDDDNNSTLDGIKPQAQAVTPNEK